jgi:ABC-type molybdate transport system permease subunit
LVSRGLLGIILTNSNAIGGIMKKNKKCNGVPFSWSAGSYWNQIMVLLPLAVLSIAGSFQAANADLFGKG